MASNNPSETTLAQQVIPTWIDGAGTLTVTGVVNDYDAWISNYPDLGDQNAFDQDSDNDGIKNGIENFFGFNPTSFSVGLHNIQQPSFNRITVSHPVNPSGIFGVGAIYEWSDDLVNFYRSGQLDENGASVTFSASPVVNDEVHVTATMNGIIPAQLRAIKFGSPKKN